MHILNKIARYVTIVWAYIVFSEHIPQKRTVGYLKSAKKLKLRFLNSKKLNKLQRFSFLQFF